MLSPPKKFKNLSLNEKIRQIITQNLSIEQFHKLNAPDLMRLLESEILIISPEIQERLLNLPISEEEKREILQELTKLPFQLQQKLLDDLESSFINDTIDSG